MALEGPTEATGWRDDAAADGPRGERNFAVGESPNAFCGHRVWNGLRPAAGLLRTRPFQLEFVERQTMPHSWTDPSQGFRACRDVEIE